MRFLIGNFSLALLLLAAVYCSSQSSSSVAANSDQVLFDIDEDIVIDANLRNDYYSLRLDDGRGSGSYVINSNHSQTGAGESGKQQFLASSGKMDESSKHLESTNEFAVNYIWRRFPIGFLVLGTIANILSIIVFTRKEMRKFSSFCYFAVLNVVNLAFLYVTLTRVIMDFNFKSDIRTLNVFTCKSHVFLTYFLGHLSSLLLSTISIDRVISVVFLHRAKDLCTPRVAFMVTAFLVAFNFVVSSHFIIFDSAHTVDTRINLTITNAKKISSNKSLSQSTSTTTPVDFGQHQMMLKEKFDLKDLVEHEYGLDVSRLLAKDSGEEGQVYKNEIVESQVVCDTRNGTFYHYFIRNTWKLIDMSLYAFLPFAIMFTCSVIIIIRVAQQSNKFKARTYKGGGAGASGASQKQQASKKSTEINRASSPNIAHRATLVAENNKNKVSIHSLKLAEQTTGLRSASSSSSLDRTLSVAAAEPPQLGKVKPSLSLAPTAHIVMNRMNSIGTSPAKLRSASSVSTPPATAINANHRPSEAKFSTRTRNLALMLIPVNILFLMFLSPVVVCMYTYENLGNDQLTLAIVEHLSYCNFTLNFFIYFLTSSKFREEFFKFLNETFRTSTLQNNSAYATQTSCMCFKWQIPLFSKKSAMPAPNPNNNNNGGAKTRYQSINNNNFKSSIKPPQAPDAATTYSPLANAEAAVKTSPRLAGKFNQLINSKNKDDDDELVGMTTTYMSANETAE